MHDLLHEGQLAAIHGGNLLVHGGARPVAAQWPSFLPHWFPPSRPRPTQISPLTSTLKRMLERHTFHSPPVAAQ